MISNSSKYAIKAVLYLAIYSDKANKIMAKDLAKRINVPPAYISKILQELSRQQIISSLKGPKGGFFLSMKNTKLPLIRIVKAIDGDHRLHACVLGLEKCNLERPCPLHDVVYPTKSELLKYLNTETIESFTKQYKLGSSYFELTSQD